MADIETPDHRFYRDGGSWCGDAAAERASESTPDYHPAALAYSAPRDLNYAESAVCPR